MYRAEPYSCCPIDLMTIDTTADIADMPISNLISYYPFTYNTGLGPYPRDVLGSLSVITSTQCAAVPNITQ